MGRMRIKGKGSVVQMTPEIRKIMERQLARFREKFGREPRPTDKVFFDPDADEPTPLTEENIEAAMMDAAKRAGIDAKTARGETLCDEFMGSGRKYGMMP